MAYTISIPFDRRLYRQDIAGSVAHAKMLGRQEIISGDESRVIVDGLLSIKDEIKRGDFPFRDELEDIHMNIEARLAELIGDVAGQAPHRALSQ